MIVRLDDLPSPPAGRNGWPWHEVPNLEQADSYASGPRFSVIVPSYNQGRYIEETLRSLLLQGCPELQVIVIDGGSTDETVNVLKRYSPWLSYWISEPDRGQSHALNKALKEVTGEWVSWLGSDDIYLPGALKRMGQIIQAHPPAQWVVGTTIFIDETSMETARFTPTRGTPSKWPSYPQGTWLDFVCSKWSGVSLPLPSSFWSKAAIEANGEFDETLHFAMDHEYYVRLAVLGFEPVCIDVPIAGFRIHDLSKSGSGNVPFFEEELRVVEKYFFRVPDSEAVELFRYHQWLTRFTNRARRRSFISRFVPSSLIRRRVAAKQWVIAYLRRHPRALRWARFFYRSRF